MCKNCRFDIIKLLLEQLMGALIFNLKKKKKGRINSI